MYQQKKYYQRGIKRSFLLIISLLFIPFSSIFSQEKKEKKLTTEFTGKYQGDYRYFPSEGLYEGQKDQYFSTVFQPELYIEWDKGNQFFQFTGFARLDQYDDKRTHVDIREMYWQKVFKTWELSIGLKKVFWGVTESNHLVDIINQTDFVEGTDLEQKLGQPMVHASFSKNWGTLDFFVMPYFRELQFPGTQGRLRPPIEVNYDNTTYESSAEKYHPDLAVRWSHSIGVFDIGLSHYYGTSRLPLFIPNQAGDQFSPFYETINQSGADIQASTGSMLWKLEAIHRESKRKTITALTVGGEYTFSNILSSGIDVGLLAEYSYDDRGIQESLTSLTNDLFLGMRIAFNDKQSTDFLGGIILDQEKTTRMFFIEASRRIGDAWKASFEIRGFDKIAEDEFLYQLRNDGFLQFSLAKYF